MEKTNSRIKRIFAASLAALMIAGALPVQPFSGFFDMTITADATELDTVMVTHNNGVPVALTLDNFDEDIRAGVVVSNLRTDKSFLENDYVTHSTFSDSFSVSCIDTLEIAVFDSEGTAVQLTKNDTEGLSGIVEYTFPRDTEKTYYLTRVGKRLDNELTGAHIVYTVIGGSGLNAEYSGQSFEVKIENFLDESSTESLFCDSEGDFSEEDFLSSIDVSYLNNKNAGEASVIFTAKQGSGFIGSYTGKFEIAPAEISDCTIDTETDPSDPIITFNGAQLVKGADYTLVMESETSGVITGIGNFTGEYSFEYAEDFEFCLEDCSITVTPETPAFFDGNDFRPVPTVTYSDDDGEYELEEGVDYTLTILDSSNNEVEQITGPGRYTLLFENLYDDADEFTMDYTVTDQQIVYFSDCEIEILPLEMVYSGTPFRPTVKVDGPDGREWTEGVDYSYKLYDGNENVVDNITGAGTYSVRLLNLTIPDTIEDNYEEDIEVEDHVHTWSSEPEFIWSADFTKATAYFICGDCAQTVDVSANISKRVTAEPTEDKEGTAVLTAAAEFNGTRYTDTRTISVPKLLSNTSSVSSEEIRYGGSADINVSSKGGAGLVTYNVLYKKVSDTTYAKKPLYSGNEPATVKYKPKRAVPYEIRVEASDETGRVSVKTLIVNVISVVNTSTISAETVMYGESVVITPSSEGGNGDCVYEVIYKKSSDTRWAVLKEYGSAKEVTFKPKKAVPYDICVNVKDGNGSVASKSFTLDVCDFVNTSRVTPEAISFGGTVSIEASSSGGKGEVQYSVRYKKSTDTKWAVMYAYGTETSFTFTPKKAVSYDICVKAKDESGVILSEYYTVTVQ